MAKPICIDIPHELGRHEARRRLEGGFDRVSRQIGSGLSFVERWEGDRLHFSAGAFGQKVVGRVDVLEKSIRLEIDLPWPLGLIAEKLRGRLANAGRLLLEKK